MVLDYKKSGVDIDLGDRLVDWLKELPPSPSPKAKNVVSGIGGFSALFRTQFEGMKKPLLVSSTDGVGTKVKLASQFNRYEGIGQDLVAMCANDLATTGADPLFFLDYYAVGKLELPQAQAFLKSVRGACDAIDCVLIGGETAEMPGTYRVGEFDCAGFIVGVVDEEKVLGPHLVRTDDVIVGVSSSGFHSNGYSLLRKTFENDLDSWVDTLMKPTHLYGPLVRDLQSQNLVHALAHVTGGGVHNIPRVLPDGLSLKLQDWEWPQAFQEVQDRTQLSRDEMLKTLNCGLGFVVIGPKGSETQIQDLVTARGFVPLNIGSLVSRPGPAEVLL